MKLRKLMMMSPDKKIVILKTNLGLTSEFCDGKLIVIPAIFQGSCNQTRASFGVDSMGYEFAINAAELAKQKNRERTRREKFDYWKCRHSVE